MVKPVMTAARSKLSPSGGAGWCYSGQRPALTHGQSVGLGSAGPPVCPLFLLSRADVHLTSRKPVNVEEAVTHLVRERLKATKSMEGTAIDPMQDVSTVEQEENDEDTVSPSATPVHTPDVVAMIQTLTAHISELQTERADLKAMFISERAEARDREQRQKNKITQLKKILNTHVQSIDKTNDMACTMLKSIDAKTTTVIHVSDLKRAGSAVRSENTSTPGT